MMQFHRNICSLTSLRACFKGDNIVGGQDADDSDDVEDADGVDDVVGVISDTFFMYFTS